jgi:hypothetical protein
MHFICQVQQSHHADEHASVYSAENAFSKKVENHAHAVALRMMYYNCVRIHRTLRMTPAMAAGVCDKLWDISDVVVILEKLEAAR